MCVSGLGFDSWACLGEHNLIYLTDWHVGGYGFGWLEPYQQRHSTKGFSFLLKYYVTTY